MKRIIQCAGYSLVEIMVTLAIVLLLQLLAWPFISDFLATMRLRAGAEALMSTLNFGRATAVQRNARVAICKSATGTSCSNVGGWQSGWLVFEDANNNGTLDNGELVLKRQAAIDARMAIKGGTNVRNFISYAPTGQAKQLSGAFLADSFVVCPVAGSANGYKIFIARTGRVRMDKAATTDCAST